MKKIFVALIFLFLIMTLPVFAEDDSNSSGGIEDAMQYTNSVQDAFNGQKPVTDEEFQKTLDKLKAKKAKGKWGKANGKKEKVFKGKNFNDENSSKYINETAEKNLLLRIPLCLINGDGAEISAGHYKIIGKKEGAKTYLDFYQSSALIARVPAIETQSDFGETNVNFVKLLPYNSQRVEVIYGSIDFNAYTFIKIKDKISD